jgi:hypothetical protein
LGGSIAIAANVCPDKFETLGEDMSLLQAEGQILGLADTKLTLHVKQGKLDCRSPAEYVVDDDPRISVVVDRDADLASQLYPSTAHVVNEHDKGVWAVDWAERHDIVTPFGSMGPANASFS